MDCIMLSGLIDGKLEALTGKGEASVAMRLGKGASNELFE